jgi:hypothetical protein
VLRCNYAIRGDHYDERPAIIAEEDALITETRSIFQASRLTSENFFFLALIVVKSFLVVGCTGSVPTKIKDILDHPREYDGRTVVIAGEVKERTNLVVVKYFVVKDETGEITVITDRAVPNPGERVRVKGRVNQAFAMGGKSVVVVVEHSGS